MAGIMDVQWLLLVRKGYEGRGLVWFTLRGRGPSLQTLFLK